VLDAGSGILMLSPWMYCQVTGAETWHGVGTGTLNHCISIPTKDGSPVDGGGKPRISPGSLSLPIRPLRALHPLATWHVRGEGENVTCIGKCDDVECMHDNGANVTQAESMMKRGGVHVHRTQRI
jgi:hypothetical protein